MVRMTGSRWWQRLDEREAMALLIALIVLAVGVFVLWLAYDMTGVRSDAGLVAVLVLPLAAYGIASGRLREFTGPGGIGLRLESVMRSRVAADLGSRELPVAEAQKLRAQGSEAQIWDRLKDDPRTPAVIVVDIGRRAGRCERGAMLRVVDSADRHARNVKFVVFKDRGRLEGFMPVWAFGALLRPEKEGTAFVKAINAGDLGAIRSQPNVLEQFLQEDATNADALRAMVEANLEALPVVSRDGHLLGVAERDQVLSELVLALDR